MITQQRFTTRGPHDTLFRIDEDGTELCVHEDAYIDKACCPPGTTDCGCYGRDSVTCPAQDCTGIEDQEVDNLMERIRSGFSART
jgi:hypothetical protein